MVEKVRKWSVKNLHNRIEDEEEEERNAERRWKENIRRLKKAEEERKMQLLSKEERREQTILDMKVSENEWLESKRRFIKRVLGEEVLKENGTD